MSTVAEAPAKFVILKDVVGKHKKGQVVEYDDFKNRPEEKPEISRLTQIQAIRPALPHEQHLKNVNVDDSSVPGVSLVDQVNNLNNHNARMSAELTELKAEYEKMKLAKSETYDPMKNQTMITLINEKDELAKQLSSKLAKAEEENGQLRQQLQNSNKGNQQKK